MEKLELKHKDITINTTGNITILSKLCSICNRVYSLKVDRDKYNLFLEKGGLLQDIFPELSSEQREFLLTGTTPEEYNYALIIF